MPLGRMEGGVQPGIRWGPFTTRIPGIHVGFSLGDMLQGGLIIAAVSGGMAPLIQKYFNVSFEVAWSLIILQIIWVITSAIVFGDPYSCGWITPALPLVIGFLGAFPPGPEAVQAMIAVTLWAIALFLFFGLTGLGSRFFALVPDALKAGIILGGAFAAFKGELARIVTAPFSLGAAWLVVLILMFSAPVVRLGQRSKVIAYLVSGAILLGMAVGGCAGIFAGEMKIPVIEWKIALPQFGPMLAALSPWGVGWPSAEVLMKAFPLALIIYVFAFGDMLVASSIVEAAAKKRPDEKVEINHTRTHLHLGIRNLGLLLTAGVWPPLAGVLFTGGHVFLAEKYARGRKIMDSIYTGVINFNSIPWLLVLLMPVVAVMKPLLPIALSLTLLLTGFACAYVGINLISHKDDVSKAVAFLMAMVTATYGAAWGLGVGVAAYLLLIGWRETSTMKNIAQSEN